MRAKGIVWVGSRTEHLDEMVAFQRDRLGLVIHQEQPGFAELRLPNGDKFEVFGPDQAPEFTTGVYGLTSGPYGS